MCPAFSLEGILSSPQHAKSQSPVIAAAREVAVARIEPSTSTIDPRAIRSNRRQAIMAANAQQQAQLDALLQQIDQLNADNQALQAAAVAAAAGTAAAAAPVNPPLPVAPAAFASCPGQHKRDEILGESAKLFCAQNILHSE